MACEVIIAGWVVGIEVLAVTVEVIGIVGISVGANVGVVGVGIVVGVIGTGTGCRG